MEKKENVEILDNEIDKIIGDIKIIEEQINFFKEKKTLFFKKKKINNKRIDDLENIKKFLFKSLECKLRKKNYLE